MDPNAFRMSFGKRSVALESEESNKTSATQNTDDKSEFEEMKRMDANAFRMSFGKRSVYPCTN